MEANYTVDALSDLVKETESTVVMGSTVAPKKAWSCPNTQNL